MNNIPSKRIYLTRLILIPFLLFLLFFEWIMTESSFLGKCEPGAFIAIMYNIARYLSMFSIVATLVLIIVFLKKSEKFFGIFIAIAFVFIIVIPYALVIFGGENTCTTEKMWEKIKCVEKNETGKCIKYSTGDE